MENLRGAAKKKSQEPESSQKASQTPVGSGATGASASPDEGGTRTSPRTRSGINEVLDKGVITRDLREAMDAGGELADSHHHRVEPRLRAGNRPWAGEDPRACVQGNRGNRGATNGQGIHLLKSEIRPEQYLFARLSAAAIRKLVELDAVEYRVGPNTYPHWAIFHIWLDDPLKGLDLRNRFER